MEWLLFHRSDKQIKERPIYWVGMTMQLSAEGFFCAYSVHDPISESRFYLTHFAPQNNVEICTFPTSVPNNP